MVKGGAGCGGKGHLLVRAATTAGVLWSAHSPYLKRSEECEGMRVAAAADEHSGAHR